MTTDTLAAAIVVAADAAGASTTFAAARVTTISAPVVAATKFPTRAPTPAPTPAPTAAPLPLPTGAPTSLPLPLPTAAPPPTPRPTKQPVVCDLAVQLGELDVAHLARARRRDQRADGRAAQPGKVGVEAGFDAGLALGTLPGHRRTGRTEPGRCQLPRLLSEARTARDGRGEHIPKSRLIAALAGLFVSTSITLATRYKILTF